MSFVLVSVDCSCCKPEGRTEIYKHLAEDGWIKMNDDAGEITSIWLGSLISGVPNEEAMAKAKNKFYSYFNPNCKPNIVFHWGINEVSQQSMA